MRETSRQILLNVLIKLVYFQVYNAPKFFELKTSMDEETNQPYIDATAMRVNPYYFSIYNIWMNFIFMGLGPFVVLISLNGLTLRSLIIHHKLQNPIEKEDSTSKNRTKSGTNYFHSASF